MPLRWKKRRQRETPQRISDVNMTPLIDLTFLLLITFMITFPVIEQGINVNLPRVSASPIDQLRSQNITVNIEGQVFLNNRMVSLAELGEQLTELAGRDPNLSVLIRGDERVAYAEIVKVLRVLRATGVTRMALVTEPAGG